MKVIMIIPILNTAPRGESLVALDSPTYHYLCYAKIA